MSTTAFYDEVRTLRRERVLDAASELISTEGWSAVTMTRVGEVAGVPRQSLYREVRSKGELGEAVVRREAERFLELVDERLSAHPDDLAAALVDAMGASLAAGQQSSLLKAILQPGESELVELLTTRPDAVLGQVVDAMRTRLLAGPGAALDPDDLEDLLDTTVRLTLSHLLQPTTDVSVARERIARVVRAIARS